MSQVPRQDLQAVNPQTGEIEILPTTLDEIARRDTGGMGREVVTTIDLQKPGGQQQLQKHLDHDQPPSAKTNDGWYGTPFKCIAITSRGVLVKKGLDGSYLPTPKPTIRTTLEREDGQILALASSYVYEDVMNIRSQVPVIDAAHHVLIKLKKGGNSDRIVRVWDDVTPTFPSPEPVKTRKAKE